MLEEMFEMINKGSCYEGAETDFLKDCLNSDKPYQTSRAYMEKNLASVDEVIKN